MALLCILFMWQTIGQRDNLFVMCVCISCCDCIIVNICLTHSRWKILTSATCTRLLSRYDSICNAVLYLLCTAIHVRTARAKDSISSPSSVMFFLQRIFVCAQSRFPCCNLYSGNLLLMIRHHIFASDERERSFTDNHSVTIFAP